MTYLGTKSTVSNKHIHLAHMFKLERELQLMSPSLLPQHLLFQMLRTPIFKSIVLSRKIKVNISFSFISP